MSKEMIFLAILISAVCTFSLRALPFLAFHGDRKMPGWLERLGQALPAAIMAVLVVYCLKDVGDDIWQTGAAKLLSVAIVAVSYKWKHNTLISIVSGTIGYMILLQVL